MRALILALIQTFSHLAAGEGAGPLSTGVAAFQERRWSEAMSAFLEVLRQARIDSGLTQTDAARLLGKPQSFIAKCEQGERRVDVVELLELCRIYGCSLREFVDNVDTQKRRRKKPKMG